MYYHYFQAKWKCGGNVLTFKNLCPTLTPQFHARVFPVNLLKSITAKILELGGDSTNLGPTLMVPMDGVNVNII